MYLKTNPKLNPHARAASAGEESAMSKILKVVGDGDGRRTYVKGGPACESKGRHRYDYGNIISRCFGCRNGMWKYSASENIECEDCHATGLQAVELWPDAELDRWLAEHFETWDLRMRRELHTNEPTYFVEGEPFIINPPGADTSRGAKVAAVVAVAEEE